MGRSIPSFRILIDIESLEWTYFKKQLCNKDKQIFSKLFLIPKLYCHALSNLSRPVIIEPIILSLLFYNFKTIKRIIQDISMSSIKYNSINDNRNKKKSLQYLSKIKHGEIDDQMDYKVIMKDWKRFKDCLNKEDENIFTNMIRDCYINYHNSIRSNLKENSESCHSRITSLFMALILYQQKQINFIKSSQRFLD